MLSGGYNPRAIYPAFSKRVEYASNSTTAVTTVFTGVAGVTPYITRILVSVVQDGASAVKVRDDQTTASVFFTHAASPGLVRLDAEFGVDGLPCTEGKSVLVQLTTASTPFAAQVLVEGYLKPTSPIAAATYATAALKGA